MDNRLRIKGVGDVGQWDPSLMYDRDLSLRVHCVWLSVEAVQRLIAGLIDTVGYARVTGIGLLTSSDFS